MPNDTRSRLWLSRAGAYSAWSKVRPVASPQVRTEPSRSLSRRRTHLGAHAIRLEQLDADRERQGFARRRPGDHGCADQRLHGSDRSRLRSCGGRPTQNNDAEREDKRQGRGVSRGRHVIPVMVRTFDVFRARV